MLLSTGQFFGGVGGGAIGDLEFSFIEGQNQTTANFASCNFGAEDPDRYIIVAAAAVRSDAGNGQMSAMTIGGVTADIMHQSASDTSEGFIAIAPLPTGTTGTVAITSTGHNRFGIGIYRVVNLASPIPHDTANRTDSGSAMSLDIPAGGAAVADHGQWNASSNTFTGGMGTDYNVSPGSSARTVIGSMTSVAGETTSIDDALGVGAASGSAAVSFR